MKLGSLLPVCLGSRKRLQAAVVHTGGLPLLLLQRLQSGVPALSPDVPARPPTVDCTRESGRGRLHPVCSKPPSRPLQPVWAGSRPVSRMAVRWRRPPAFA